MEFNSIRYKHAVLVAASGRIDSYSAPQLADVLDSFTNDGDYNLVLSLKDVDFISSAGLRVLISTQKTCKNKNGELVLSEISERVNSALELAGFNTLFKMFNQDIDAVGYF